MNTPLLPASTLADLAVSFPAASRVFRRHGLDYCCHGRRPVSEACAERGLDAAALLSEVFAETRTASDLKVWSDQPLPEIVERIVSWYHARLRAELPLVLQMARKVEAVHAEKPTVPRGLADHLEALARTLLDHLEKEEQGLFPALLSGRPGAPSSTIVTLEREHEDVALALQKTRSLTTDLVPPAEACTTWRALYLRLDEFEAELMEHVHLENNVLFRRALCADL
ncbi:iron-sulfur cluster repair di-iron protein [bacterium]|nr:iron-sulfur cluster repair di-iron protein [bacterium]